MVAAVIGYHIATVVVVVAVTIAVVGVGFLSAAVDIIAGVVCAAGSGNSVIAELTQLNERRQLIWAVTM